MANPFDLNNFLSNYPGRDRIQELQQIDYTNNPRNMGEGTASDFRHAAAMNELSKSLSPGFVPDVVGDSLAYGLGYINEVPDMFRGVNMGQLASGIATMNPNTFKGAFQPEAIAAAQEDLVANKLGTFGTPNTATIEDVFAKTLGYQAPGTNIQTASGIGNPMGYGAAQASDLTNLERDFPGMSTGDIIDSMNNRAFIGRQITPMAKPNVVDPNRIPGRIQEAVKPQYTIRGQIADDFGEIKNKIGSGLGSIRDFFGSGINKAKEGIMDSSPMNFLRGLPTPGNLLMNMAATRNPLNPRASNYNPTLQGQVDYMKDKGMYGTNPNSGLGQITGGRLTGKNLVSGFGSNDLGEMYSKDLSKLQGYLSTMPQRFSRLMKNNPNSYKKKIENLQNKIKQNKIEAQAAQAAREAATAARARARNPNVYANAGVGSGGFASQNTGTNSNFSNRTGRGRTGYSEGGLASMFTRRG